MLNIPLEKIKDKNFVSLSGHRMSTRCKFSYKMNLGTEIRISKIQNKLVCRDVYSMFIPNIVGDQI